MQKAAVFIVSAIFLSLPPQKEEDGFGTFWHPTALTQRKTVEIVIMKAKEMMGW